jgi:hypothetical protein
VESLGKLKRAHRGILFGLAVGHPFFFGTGLEGMTWPAIVAFLSGCGSLFQIFDGVVVRVDGFFGKTHAFALEIKTKRGRNC